MKSHGTRVSHERQQAGVATLIAIFILLLISAVALALVAASDSETSLASNYRSSTRAYYAGIAGLEEARGRLLQGNPNWLGAFVPSPVAVNQVRYILNPATGETVAPTALTTAGTYPDNEYTTEFGVPVTSTTVQTTASTSTIAGVQGPTYKWVRINAITEKSIGKDVDGNGVIDTTTPLYYDSAHVTASGASEPSLVLTGASGTAMQALELTALAVTPDGSEKLVQYVVAPLSLGLNFGSPLTLAGPNVALNPASSNSYYVNGQDGQGNPGTVSGCATNPSTSLPAIGVTSTSNISAIQSSISRTSHYTGGGLADPSVGDVSSTMNANLETPSGLSTVIQQIQDNADLVYTPPSGQAATQSNLPSDMSATNPKTVVIDGDFTMS